MRLRRRLVLATALGAASCAGANPDVPRATAHPVRVMSLNQCTDQLVLALLPPERIASVTWLSRNPGSSLMAGAARRVGINHGLAEEVLAQKPDLVIAGSYTTPGVRNTLKRLGYPLVEIDNADSIADVRWITRQVAAAVDERPRGEALIAYMDAKLAGLALDRGPPLRVVAWDRSGFSAGEGTLYDAVLTAAGARNLARAPMAVDYRNPDIETLLRANPALIVQGSGEPAGFSLGNDVMGHRLVRRYWGNRMLGIPQAYYVCGTPALADGAIRLRAQLRAAADRAGPALPIGSGLR